MYGSATDFTAVEPYIFAIRGFIEANIALYFYLSATINK